ncbi:isoprenyl transferase [Sporosarcina thermotolerans]|uniref:Isoprenyl transferase n=1 Tax=Sporosarcina thermotolerans TaxID=633404 RepID=A0AAW9A5G3_9BACL|nr:isoprenyl transferase [Sporosarcina thermotolerans]MDW0116129.1 isoprenyl transferase [Sporosarcina thermotolerans]
MLEKIWWKKTPDIDEKTLSFRVNEARQKTVPSHVAIIMDGNGRWAKQRNLPRVMGHHEGMKTVRKITRFANRLGIRVLTLYAFSTENWKRPRFEVDFLMKLPVEFLSTYLPELIEENVRVEMIGDFSALPTHTQKAIKDAMDATANNDGLILNFAMNYGSRLELLNMVKAIGEMARKGEILPEDIDESLIESNLMTSHLPEPDLLIRTSGEVRLSNFMLWQLAYTEFNFTDVYWPDFNEECLLSAIEDFQSRNRRYGGVVEGIGAFNK